MQSQKALASTIKRGLQDREIVCLWGNPNGKTHVFYQIMANLSIGLDGRLMSTIKPSHSENYTVEILEGIEITMCNDQIDINRIRRQMMTMYGTKPPHGSLDVNHRWMKMLIALNEARIIPCLAFDEAELLPRKGFNVIKKLNETRAIVGKNKTIAVGPSFIISGNFAKRKMPENFWLHCKEVQVGKVSIDEIAEFIQHLVPGFDQKFTRAAMQKITEAQNTLEMSRIVKNTVDYWRRNYSDDEMIDKEIIKAATDKMSYSKVRLAA